MENNSKAIKKKKKWPLLTFMSIFVIAAVVVLLVSYFNLDALCATRKYNKAVSKYNETLEKYNQSISKSSVENLEDCEAPADELETVSEKRDDIKKSISNGNSAANIRKEIIPLQTFNASRSSTKHTA